MAVYKGREVQILGRLEGGEVSPSYRVIDSYGQKEVVELSNLQVTKDEEKQLKGDAADLNVNVIEDKDLQTLRDTQDPEKIKAKQDKENKDVTVPVSEIKVDKKAVK